MDAFRDAELLAEALDAGLSARRDLEAAMQAYEEQRNRAAMPLYQLTCRLAALQPPPPEMKQLFGAVQGNQEQTDRLLGAHQGTVPIPEFFSPDNVRRIMAAATATWPAETAGA
jgi:2-polyprenyl-6-methoxyphenol hydroxylase-like FAD-dependent oxidoreductase